MVLSHLLVFSCLYSYVQGFGCDIRVKPDQSNATCRHLILAELLSLQVADSQHIDADRLLRLVPAGQLLEVRALLLERFGRHQEILR